MPRNIEKFPSIKSIKLVKSDEGISRKISESYEVTNLIVKQDSKDISLAISKAENHSEITENIKSDRIYYILEGELVVKTDNKKFVVQKGDSLFIPKNTKYQFEGTFRAILINSPAFDSQDERISKIFSRNC